MDTTSNGACMDRTGTPAVHCVHVAVGHVFGDGAAAALVHLAQLTRLPDDAGPGKQAAHPGHQLGAGLGRVGLAAHAGVPGDDQAAV